MNLLFDRISLSFYSTFLAASILMTATLLGACAEGSGDDTGPGDAGGDTLVDTPVRRDAIVQDAVIRPDMNFPDRGTPDMLVPDMGIPDMGTPDMTIPDATPDMNIPDATPDAPLCMTAACDDGLVCNGSETCGANNQCMAGTAPNCNDNIACTTDSCAEPGGCSNVPNNAACPGTEICDPAMGCIAPTCAESPCKLVSPQCGCLTGDGCYLSANGPICAAAGNVPSGGTCSNAQCSPGFTCITDGATATCRQNCVSTTDCTGSSQCLVTLSGGEKVCTNPCLPNDQTGCGTGTKCDIFNTPAGDPVSDCSEPGAGLRGTSCTDTLDCAKGFGCFNIGTPTCRKWCRVGIDTDCTSGDTCVGFVAGSELIVDGINYGACAP